MQPATTWKERRATPSTALAPPGPWGRWLLVAAIAIPALPAWGAELPDAERGRLLYENHCVVCHTSRVHRRAAPLPMNLKELRGIVAGWASDQKLNWSDSDISDVVEYLDSTYYRMLGR